jgi:glycosyltransferase involved in cell wall biosynthesis
VIIPAKDAADSLPAALNAIASQTYPNIVDVVVAAADEASAQASRGATVVDNPAGNTAKGLNLAIAEAKGDVLVRCDAHAILPNDYVATAVSTLLSTESANVGGMQVPVGDRPWERAIGSAMTSPLGAGDARYRIGGDGGPAETVYLGVFRRGSLEAIGGFDESFVRTQDYELNHRLIEAGETVWFDPSLKVKYKPRGSLRDLARQYWDYGAAKRQFNAKHPDKLRWRQILPPLLVIAVVVSILVSFWVPTALLLVAVYLLVMLLAGLPSWRKSAALVTMHLAWGLGFLVGGRRR